MAPVLLHLPAAALLLMGCACALPLHDPGQIPGHNPGQGPSPAQVDPLSAERANPQCWDSSSALLLELRSPRIADTVPAFWDLMLFLRGSDNSKHTALFWDLARVFWDLYLDCVMARSHGLGRRHVTAVHSLITDRSFRFNSSGANSQAWLSVRVRRRGHIKETLKTKPKTAPTNKRYHIHMQ